MSTPVNREQLARELVAILHEGTRGRIPLAPLADEVDLISESGLDSIEALDILLRVEERFQVAVADEDLSREMFRSFAQFRDYVERRLDQGKPGLVAKSIPGASLEGVKPLCERGSKAPVFFVPGGAGGLAELEVYGQLVRLWGDERPVHQFVARGLESDSPPHTSVAEIARYFYAALTALQPEGSVILVGECVGGVVALELAQQLRRAGRDIAMLMFLDSWFPSAIPPAWIAPVGFKALVVRAQKFAQHKALARVQRALKQALTGQDPAMSERIERVGRSYLAAALAYEPAPYPGAITLIASEESSAIDPALGWTGVAADLALHGVKGDHESYLRQHRESLAACVVGCLAAVS
jgi:thioesterase domain-containing protein/acyl carrier protein